ncbi:MAG: hypothetical protein Q8N60_01065 [Candidatus Diapherotrites archaeon]|nr:hypothetical protein [Candidatus Diapherotrites archaeon]
MDTFTFAISIVLMMLAIQFEQNWLIFAIVALMVLTMRSISTTLLLIVSTVVLYVTRDYLKEYWPFVLFGLIILAALIGAFVKKYAEQAPMDMYGGGFGGGFEGGLGGLPGGL